jgi:ferredoxin--NADP+ reductase
VRSAAVIGAGNVALDIVRFLVKDPRDFAKTDLPDSVLTELARKEVDEVHLIARGRADQSRFTPVELAELGELDGVDLVVGPRALAVATAAAVNAQPAHSQTNVRLLSEFAQRPTGRNPRRIVFHFESRPVEVLGCRRVSGVLVEHPGGARSTVPAELVVRAIGYLPLPLPGLPFDMARAVVPNQDGRVLGADGLPLAGHYVAGWLKRGPSGVIGTNKSDAAETVQALLADLPWASSRPLAGDMAVTLANRGVNMVDWSQWLRLRDHEAALGAARSAAAAKLEGLSAMLAVCAGELAASPRQ